MPTGTVFKIRGRALLGSEGWAVSSLQADIALMTDIRLPRTLGACLAGALLGLAGAVAQGLFRNPLADPYLLGSASGASLGVALGMVMLSQLDVSPWLVRAGVTGMAFMGAWLAVALSLMLSWTPRCPRARRPTPSARATSSTAMRVEKLSLLCERSWKSRSELKLGKAASSTPPSNPPLLECAALIERRCRTVLD
ncbi:MAG: hypothetical protein EB085_09085 [Betaproteobacteria bacterium]|nr:hypothetical protein [Betaproteobacteria bacterium]